MFRELVEKPAELLEVPAELPGNESIEETRRWLFAFLLREALPMLAVLVVGEVVLERESCFSIVALVPLF